VNALEAKKAAVDAIVSNDLKPRISALKEQLGDYRRAIELSKEIEIIQNEERQYSVELNEKETQTNPKGEEYIIKEFFDPEVILAFEEKLIDVLKACNYGGYSSARLNMDTFDLELGGNPKIYQSVGMCGILNMIVAMTMVDFLIERNRPAPGFLIADSPLSALSEPASRDRDRLMNRAFLNLLISHSVSEQVIIAEQREKMPFLPEETATTRVIEFTGDENKDRYGLLPGVYNPEIGL
jgi:hypothetical protein